MPFEQGLKIRICNHFSSVKISYEKIICYYFADHRVRKDKFFFITFLISNTSSAGVTALSTSIKNLTKITLPVHPFHYILIIFSCLQGIRNCRNCIFVQHLFSLPTYMAKKLLFLILFVSSILTSQKTLSQSVDSYSFKINTKHFFHIK